MTLVLTDTPAPPPAAANPGVPRQQVEMPAPLLAGPGPSRGTVKVLVTGGFGAGKTTLVRTLTELPPVTCDVTITEPAMTVVKPATTSGIDFGRLRLRSRSGEVTVCLFGLPGLSRFWPGLWPHIATGAIGAIVVVDPRDVAGCFTAIDHCEQAGLPFVVAVNRIDASPAYGTSDVRAALRIDEAVPVVSCDLRVRRPATTVVASLVEHALASRRRHPAAHPEWTLSTPAGVFHPSKENE